MSNHRWVEISGEDFRKACESLNANPGKITYTPDWGLNSRDEKIIEERIYSYQLYGVVKQHSTPKGAALSETLIDDGQERLQWLTVLDVELQTGNTLRRQGTPVTLVDIWADISDADTGFQGIPLSETILLIYRIDAAFSHEGKSTDELFPDTDFAPIRIGLYAIQEGIAHSNANKAAGGVALILAGMLHGQDDHSIDQERFMKDVAGALPKQSEAIGNIVTQADDD